ncbi:MAG: aldo/keto reductase [Candidatus Polarisedimenticolaceae bacterium]|nr:aldo/keto reductase [Candidatus Polarisedimenticolaceae bacterium]
MTTNTLAKRPLGNTALQISTLGLGGWNTYGDLVKAQTTVNQIIHTAFDHGVNFFDMANNYADGRAEEMMGIALNTLPRDALILSSKVFMAKDPNERGLSEAKIKRGIERSLKRIGTDYIDIYFCHRYDPNTPLEETIATMGELIQQGKIRHWGSSTWSASQIAQAHTIAHAIGVAPPMVEQPELNLLRQIDYPLGSRREIAKKGMGVVTFSPLASGLLSGKYERGIPDDSRLAKIDWLRNSMQKQLQQHSAQQLKSLANQLNCQPAQLAIAWCLTQPGVSSAITGASRLEQLIENLGAAEITISTEIMQKLDQIYAPSYLKKLKWKARMLLSRMRQ